MRAIEELRPRIIWTRDEWDERQLTEMAEEER